MWNLNLKRSINYYVHIYFAFLSVLMFIIPFTMGIVFKLNGTLYIVGYGIIYLLGFYLISWVIVPFLLLIYNRLLRKLSVLSLSILILISVCLLSIMVYSIFDLDNERIYIEFCVSPLFLWIIYVISEIEAPSSS